ncbi:hypothetical protein SLZ27_005795 [Pseudomonas aeruginosa]|nr:hypothetical protein [Pseudomonas aeruginosa]
MDYSIFYKRPIKVDRLSHELPVFDLFISAYNSSDRVNQVFQQVCANKKIWLIHPEYQYTPLELPLTEVKVIPEERDEISQTNSLLEEIGDISGKSIAIDITGFMRHVIAFLVPKLAHFGVKEFTAIYSEPMYYSKQEDTTFSTSTSGQPRPVRGMSGSNNSNGADYLILGVGYDHKLIGEVANAKDNATIFPVFSFPSLSPDMYQQSAIRASESGAQALENTWITKRRFAPANDPFSTAEIISEIVHEIDKVDSRGNIYLSPLSTKVQVLGFSLYWHLEGRHRDAVSLLLPECITYSRETSTGLKRLWAYTVEI